MWSHSHRGSRCGFVYSRYRSTGTDGSCRQILHTRLSRLILPCAHITLWLQVSQHVSDERHSRTCIISCLSVGCFLTLSSSFLSRASTFSLTVYFFSVLLINFHVVETAEEKTSALTHNGEYCPVAIDNPLTGFEPKLLENFDYSESTEMFFQDESGVKDTELSYSCDAELDDEIIGKALSSPLFSQKKGESANRDKLIAFMKKVCCQLSPFSHDPKSSFSYGTSVVNQRSGDGWISGWSKILAFYQWNSWAKLWVTRRDNCLSTEQNHHRFNKRVSLEEMKAHEEDWFLWGRQIAYLIYEYFRVTGANDPVDNYADLFTVVLRNDDIQEFDSKWHEIPLSMTKIPSDDMLEGLHKLRIRESENLKTVLELYDLETHQKKLGPNYHRLKAMVKNKKFEIRTLGWEAEILRRTPWSRIREQNSVYKEFMEIVGNGKPMGSVWKETLAVSATISISVAKLHHQIRLRILSCSRMSENHRGPEVPEGRVTVVECRDGLARITLQELAITHFVKNGTLQNACSTRPRVVVGLGRSAHSHIVRLMNTKWSNKNDDKSAVAILKKGDWHGRGPVTDQGHDRSGQPDKRGDKKLERNSSKRQFSDARQLGCVFSGHDAAEVYSPEEHWHAEANPACKVQEGCCASH